MHLLVFPSRPNLKLHNISVLPKLVKKIIANFDLSKAADPNCIPVVVLKYCDPELSYILAALFKKCLKESFGRFHWQSLYLRMFETGLQLKATALLVLFLWSVNYLKNNRK